MGTAAVTKVTITENSVVVAAVLIWTVPATVSTDTTVVPLAIAPSVSETLEPTEMDATAEVSINSSCVEPPTSDASATTVCEVVYVGASVGEYVGESVGDCDGAGVGLPGVYVGVRVGDAVGTALGMVDGLGVGDPSLYVGT